jgi:hypothetical protein
MNTYLFSLIIGFCSPVECQEFIIATGLSENACNEAAILAEGLYSPIPSRALYSHYMHTFGADKVQGYPNIEAAEIKCTYEAHYTVDKVDAGV